MVANEICWKTAEEPKNAEKVKKLNIKEYLEFWDWCMNSSIALVARIVRLLKKGNEKTV